MRVLLVEDDEELLEALAEGLGLSGHEVYPAQRHEEARAIAATWRPDAVVLDLVLARNGVGTLPAAAESGDWGGAAVVLASGSSGAYLSAAAERIGAVAVLRKPYGLKELVELLRAAHIRTRASREGTGDWHGT